MKLYMKQKVFSLNDKFTIKDEEGNDKYKVEGEIFTLGKKLHVYNMEEREIAFIEQKLMTFMPKFFVYVNGEKIIEIVKKFTFLKPKYEIIGKDWITTGDIWGHEYTISNANSGFQIANIKKEWMTWGDSYLIDIADDQDETAVMAVILGIDAAVASQNN